MTDQEQITDQVQQLATAIETTNPGSQQSTSHRRRRRKRSAEGSLKSRNRISNPRAAMSMAGIIGLVALIGFGVYWINVQRNELRRVTQDTKRYQQVATDFEIKAAQLRVNEIEVYDVHSGEAGDPLEPVKIPAVDDGILTLRLHLPPMYSGLRELVFLDAESKERGRARAKASSEGIMFINVQGLTRGRYEIVCRSLQIQQRGKFQEPMYRFAITLN